VNSCIQFQKQDPAALIPTRQRDGDAGYDIHALHDAVVQPGVITRIHTGIAIAIPHGYVGLVCPRSGLAANYGITVVNAPGVIDSNYRGELQAILTSLCLKHEIRAGDRVAQLVIVPLCSKHYRVVDEFTDTTERGALGFGSSGR
jgi:dUTP pyrophosphatase